jgi:hypothetical protein
MPDVRPLFNVMIHHDIKEDKHPVLKQMFKNGILHKQIDLKKTIEDYGTPMAVSANGQAYIF